jgi:hypothetical protein
MPATPFATVPASFLSLALAIGLAVSAGCSSPTTPAGGPVTADVERALEEEQKRAHDAEMARQREGGQ